MAGETPNAHSLSLTELIRIHREKMAKDSQKKSDAALSQYIWKTAGLRDSLKDQAAIIDGLLQRFEVDALLKELGFHTRIVVPQIYEQVMNPTKPVDSLNLGYPGHSINILVDELPTKYSGELLDEALFVDNLNSKFRHLMPFFMGYGIEGVKVFQKSARYRFQYPTYSSHANIPGYQIQTGSTWGIPQDVPLERRETVLVTGHRDRRRGPQGLLLATMYREVDKRPTYLRHSDVSNSGTGASFRVFEHDPPEIFKLQLAEQVTKGLFR